MKYIQKKGRKEIVNLCFFSTLLFVALANGGYCGSAKGKEGPIKKIENAVTKEKIKSKIHETADSVDQGKEMIKSKFHEAADYLSQEKVHESIDSVADYLDKEKLKGSVDEIAEYFDKEKIKGFIDFAAEHLDKEKIKDMIDVLADALDREKVKGAYDEIVASVDKEEIKETFDQSVDKVAASLQDVTHSLEEQIANLGNNKNAISNTVKKYNWNQWIPDRASYGPATLSDLKLGGTKKAVVVKPGQQLEGEVVCSLNRKECSPLSLYRVVLGIKNVGGQTTIFNHFGIRAGKETDHFVLTAPREKGVYQVGFRVVEAAREGTAIQAWDDRDENGWGEPPVIGLIIVV